MLREITCKICGGVFSAAAPDRAYCSPKCRNRSAHLRRCARSPARTLEPKACAHCAQPFQPKNPQQIYCADSCSNSAAFERNKDTATARKNLAKFTLDFLEQRMPEQASKLVEACRQKRGGRPEPITIARYALSFMEKNLPRQADIIARAYRARRAA